MKIAKSLLVPAGAFSSITGYSQGPDATLQSRISPSTPIAGSLGRYGEASFSLYTGIPNIGIPIYEIKVGTFTMPISLGYALNLFFL